MFKCETLNFLGIFTNRVPIFEHGTQGLCFYYLPNIESKVNKFKWKILDNWNYDHFHNDGDFSHLCAIMHKHFSKKLKM